MAYVYTNVGSKHDNDNLWQFEHFFKTCWKTWLSHVSSTTSLVRKCRMLVQGVFESFFDGICGLRSETPTHYLKDFSSSRNGWFDCFFKIFKNWNPFLRGFHFKTADLYLFIYHFCNFHKMGLSFKDFLMKMGPKSKDLLWKTNPFGWHIPLHLNIWVPPLTDEKRNSLLGK